MKTPIYAFENIIDLVQMSLGPDRSELSDVIGGLRHGIACIGHEQVVGNSRCQPPGWKGLREYITMSTLLHFENFNNRRFFNFADPPRPTFTNDSFQP